MLAKGSKKKSNKKRQQSIFLIVILAFPLLNFLIFYVAVNFNSILFAFQNIDKDYNYTFAGFDNFASVIENIKSSNVLLISIKNSVTMFVVTLLIGFPCNIFFAYFIHKKWIGHKAIRITVMLPTIISGMMISLIFLKFVENALPEIIAKFFGKENINLMTDTRYAFGTIIFYALWTGFSTSLIVYSNAMNSISPEITESLKIDGATNLQEIWHCILPMIYPTIMTYFITGIASIFTISGPLYVFYDVAAPEAIQLTGYHLFANTIANATIRDFPYLSAIGLILTFISLPLTLFVKWVMEKNDPMSDKAVKVK